MDATIEEVARRAGVSIATVSRSLRGREGVSPRTAERVRAIAHELGYSASPSASRLASGRAGTVAVIMPFLGRWFFSEVLDAAEPVFREAGLDLLLYHVGDRESRRKYFSVDLLRKRVEGVLLVSLPLTDAEIEVLHSLGIPVCTVGVALEGFRSVTIDDVSAARLAAQHLVNLGHERVALIAGDTEDPTLCGAPRDRRAGYRSVLEEAGTGLDPGLEARGDFTAAGGAMAAGELFARQHPPTAIFAESDEMAIGALGTLRRLGLRVPQDVSVVGFDDHPLAAALELTTVSQGVADQGRRVAEQLVASLTAGSGPGAGASEQVQLPTRLIVRGTTAVAKPAAGPSALVGAGDGKPRLGPAPGTRHGTAAGTVPRRNKEVAPTPGAVGLALPIRAQVTTQKGRAVQQ